MNGAEVQSVLARAAGWGSLVANGVVQLDQLQAGGYLEPLGQAALEALVQAESIDVAAHASQQAHELEVAVLPQWLLADRLLERAYRGTHIAAVGQQAGSLIKRVQVVGAMPLCLTGEPRFVRQFGYQVAAAKSERRLKMGQRLR